MPAVAQTHLDLLLQELLEAGNLHNLVIDWFAAVDGEREGLGLLCGRLGLLADGNSHGDWLPFTLTSRSKQERTELGLPGQSWVPFVNSGFNGGSSTVRSHTSCKRRRHPQAPLRISLRSLQACSSKQNAAHVIKIKQLFRASPLRMEQRFGHNDSIANPAFRAATELAHCRRL